MFLKKLFCFNKNTKKHKINNIIMFGAPGVGKGTYGKLIQKDYNLKKISTGDEIRKIVKDGNENDEEIRRIKNIIKNGEFLDDNNIIKIILNSTKEKKNFNGFIFDGFPRTLNQFNLMKEHFDFNEFKIVNCILNEKILIEKLLGRRVCTNCNANYNLCSINKDGYEMEPLLPKIENICDDCGNNLSKREDDVESIIIDRLKIYNKETMPILEQFKKLNIKIINFEPKKGIKDYPSIKKLIDFS